MEKTAGWPHLSVFDLDQTLITSNCSFDFYWYLVSQNALPFSTLIFSIFYYLRHTFLRMPPSELHKKVFDRFLDGRAFERFEMHVTPFIEGYLDSVLYHPVFSELKLAQHLGYYTLLLSNSPDFLVKQIAQMLKVNHYEATRYALDKDQKFCHIATIMQGEEKAASVLKIAEGLGIERTAITAYSDSIWDLPLLEAVGTAVVINPDQRLKKISRQHKWKML